VHRACCACPDTPRYAANDRHRTRAEHWNPHNYVPWREGQNYSPLGGLAFAYAPLRQPPDTLCCSEPARCVNLLANRHSGARDNVFFSARWTRSSGVSERCGQLSRRVRGAQPPSTSTSPPGMSFGHGVGRDDRRMNRKLNLLVRVHGSGSPLPIQLWLHSHRASA
jgi:hypothetical protein